MTKLLGVALLLLASGSVGCDGGAARPESASAGGATATGGGLAATGGNAATEQTSGGTAADSADAAPGTQDSGVGAAGSPGQQEGSFDLAWEDTFDAVDLTRWQLMTHSWDGNLAQFAAENATAEAGILKLSLTAAPDDTAKPYRGVEMRSRDTLTYGKVEASVRFAAGSAVVSSLVLLYTPWPPPDWNELDIEFLGENTDRIQFNHMINIPPADPETGHLQYPQLVTLDFNPSADFHTYAIEWVPHEARFLVDGVLLYTATEEMSRMVLPQNILLTIWASDSAAWAGAVDTTTAPTSIEYDWIKVYTYVTD